MLLLRNLLNLENLSIHQYQEEINDFDKVNLAEIPIIIGLKLRANGTLIHDISDYIDFQVKIIYEMYYVDINVSRCFINDKYIDDEFLDQTLYNRERFYNLLSPNNYNTYANIDADEYQFFCLKIDDNNQHFINSRRYLEFFFTTNNYYNKLISSGEDYIDNFNNSNSYKDHPELLIEENVKKLDWKDRKKFLLQDYKVFHNSNISNINNFSVIFENFKRLKKTEAKREYNYSDLNLYVVSIFYSPKLNLRNYSNPVLDQVDMHYQYFYSGVDKMDYFDINIGNIITKDLLFGSYSNKTNQIDIHYSTESKSNDKNTFSSSMTYGLSPIKSNIERNYSTFIELMSRIGGFGNFMFFFFSILAKYLNRYCFINELTKNLIQDFANFKYFFDQKKNYYVSDKYTKSYIDYHKQGNKNKQIYDNFHNSNHYNAINHITNKIKSSTNNHYSDQLISPHNIEHVNNFHKEFTEDKNFPSLKDPHHTLSEKLLDTGHKKQLKKEIHKLYFKEDHNLINNSKINNTNNKLVVNPNNNNSEIVSRRVSFYDENINISRDSGKVNLKYKSKEKFTEKLMKSWSLNYIFFKDQKTSFITNNSIILDTMKENDNKQKKEYFKFFKSEVKKQLNIDNIITKMFLLEDLLMNFENKKLIEENTLHTKTVIDNLGSFSLYNINLESKSK